MTRRRMTLMCFLVLVGVSGVAGESVAEEKIAYGCRDVSSQQQICVADSDGSNAAVLTAFPSGTPVDFDVSPNRRELIVVVAPPCGVGNSECVYRVPLDGSPVTQLPLAETPSIYGGIAWFDLPPPSVASLSPFNQTITVFLLGMIASALIMRGRQVSQEQT